VADVTAQTAPELVAGVGAAPGARPGARPGVIVDGTDNYETRYLLNDLAVREGIPLVYAGAVSGEAMSMTVLPGRAACLRCVFPEAPAPEARATCDTVGVFGPAVAVAGAWQAGEALKILLGREDLLSGSLARFDLAHGRTAATSLAGARDASCVCCGQGRFEWLDAPEAAATTLCGRSSVQVAAPDVAGASRDEGRGFEALAERLRAAGEVTANRFLVRVRLRDERGAGGEDVSLTVFRDGRTIVSGTTDGVRARSLVARYVGA
ncbi:MAG: ThiF family adenylyltransferase, partial [Phycisphaerales bacterium]|nr:ThiF family adenylyltransferase [Phycisphaerales bacterium]